VSKKEIFLKKGKKVESNLIHKDQFKSKKYKNLKKKKENL
jgi:hypothetical protein